MRTQHDAVALAGYLYRSPGAYRMFLRGQSERRLGELAERTAELPVGHRQQLEAELRYRGPSLGDRDGRWWMKSGAGE